MTRVLVVEDSATQALQLRLLLESEGFEVEQAPDGAEGLQRVQASAFDLVITDILMPGLNGYELCTKLKANPKTRDIPVILLTTLSDPMNIIEGLECGADNFITKPYVPEFLVERIRSVLTNKSLRMNRKVKTGVEVLFLGKRFTITSEKEQILDLLISTFEDIVRTNSDLQAKQEALTRANQSLVALYRIAKAVNGAAGEQEIVEQVLARATELPSVQAAWMFLREGAQGFRFAGAHDLPPALAAPDTMEGDCLCRRQLLSGELSHVTNIPKCERLQRASGDTRGLCCHASIPLSIGDRMVGLMNLVASQERLFGDDELQVLNGIGNQIALALERAQLQAELERRVTERTAELQRSEERYRTLAESAEDQIFIMDRGTRLEYANQAVAKLFGIPPRELIGKPLRELFSGTMPQSFAMALEGVFANGASTFTEESITFPDGARWMSTRLVPLRGDRGPVRSVLGVSRDVSEQRHLAEQLRQAQKLETVGQLAGSVAHDFNNLLTVILGYSCGLPKDVTPSDEVFSQVREDLEEIHKAGQSAAGLVQQLLAFSRKQIVQPVVLNLNQVVRDFESMLRRLLREDIELRTFLATDLGHIRADIGQIEQVLMNLIVNSRDAIPAGGQITIETANVELEEADVRDDTSLVPGRYAVLAVSDTGLGMTEEVRARLFEPFFTTKPKGQGTGLGLATVYGIVKQNGGGISVRSQPGRGSSFKIHLPCIDESLQEGLAPSEVRDVQNGSETVLLAEDEDGVRTLARRVLTRRGYRVLEARNGDEALRVAAQHADRLDLLLTDVILPGMSGRELAQGLAAQYPHVRLLYMSGYSDEAIASHGELAPGIALLQKPFTPETLARAVREVLDKN